MNKNYGKHIVVIELIKTHDAGILLANGGGVASIPSPLFFETHKTASSIILPWARRCV